MLCPSRSGTAIPPRTPASRRAKAATQVVAQRAVRTSRQSSTRSFVRKSPSEGSQVRKVSKAEAVVRGIVLGALKGDQRHLTMLFRLAEQTGQLQETGGRDITKIERVMVSWRGQDD